MPSRSFSVEDSRKIHEFFCAVDWFKNDSDLFDFFKNYRLTTDDIIRLTNDYNSAPIKSLRWKTTLDDACQTTKARALLDLFNTFETDAASKELLDTYKECKEILEKRCMDCSPDICVAETYFERQKELLLNDWDAANLGIWVSQYRFGDEQLADKLLEKYRQGLTIMIILQEDGYNRQLQESHWKHMPCSVWWYPQTREGINHHKFCVIDGQVLWHGSFNFTWSASNRNQEEFTRDINPPMIRKFAGEFTRIRSTLEIDD